MVLGGTVVGAYLVVVDVEPGAVDIVGSPAAGPGIGAVEIVDHALVGLVRCRLEF